MTTSYDLKASSTLDPRTLCQRCSEQLGRNACEENLNINTLPSYTKTGQVYLWYPMGGIEDRGIEDILYVHPTFLVASSCTLQAAAARKWRQRC